MFFIVFLRNIFIPISDNKESIIFENEKQAIKTAQLAGVNKTIFADKKYKLAQINATPKDFSTLFKNIFIYSRFLCYLYFNVKIFLKTVIIKII